MDFEKTESIPTVTPDNTVETLLNEEEQEVVTGGGGADKFSDLAPFIPRRRTKRKKKPATLAPAEPPAPPIPAPTVPAPTEKSPDVTVLSNPFAPPPPAWSAGDFGKNDI